MYVRKRTVVSKWKTFFLYNRLKLTIGFILNEPEYSTAFYTRFQLRPAMT